MQAEEDADAIGGMTWCAPYSDEVALGYLCDGVARANEMCPTDGEIGVAKVDVDACYVNIPEDAVEAAITNRFPPWKRFTIRRLRRALRVLCIFFIPRLGVYAQQDNNLLMGLPSAGNLAGLSLALHETQTVGPVMYLRKQMTTGPVTITGGFRWVDDYVLYDVVSHLVLRVGIFCTTY